MDARRGRRDQRKARRDGDGDGVNRQGVSGRVGEPCDRHERPGVQLQVCDARAGAALTTALFEQHLLLLLRVVGQTVLEQRKRGLQQLRNVGRTDKQNKKRARK